MQVSLFMIRPKSMIVFYNVATFSMKRRRRIYRGRTPSTLILRAANYSIRAVLSFLQAGPFST